MTKPAGINGVMTDYGFVILLPRTVAWLDSLSPQWFALYNKKKKEVYEHEKIAHKKIRLFINSIILMAEMYDFHGNTLREF